MSHAGQAPDKEQLAKAFNWLRTVKSMSHTAEMYAHDAKYGQVFRFYQDTLRTCNAVDFDDILVLVTRIYTLSLIHPKPHAAMLG